MTAHPMGFVVWEGPSAFDGSPVGVVVTHVHHDPQNRKLGAMAQAWILPRDVAPNVAIYTGEDKAVCGNCTFRPSVGGGCYVPIPQTAQRVWYAWRTLGTYLDIDLHDGVPEILNERALRIGAWGDPAAVPLWVWQQLVTTVPKWTSYTEQWRTLPPQWRGWCMASVKSDAEREEAKALGWRTFRVRLSGDPILAGERVCPAADESPTAHKATCERCHYCDGRRATPASDVTLLVHGQKHRLATKTLEAEGGQVDPDALRPHREKAAYKTVLGRSMARERARGKRIRETNERIAKKALAVAVLRTFGPNGARGRELFDALPLSGRGSYVLLMRNLAELREDGILVQTGGVRKQWWSPVDRTIRDHLLFLLSDRKPWYRDDLVEQALYERLPQVIQEVDRLIAENVVSVEHDGRYRLAAAADAPAEAVCA